MRGGCFAYYLTATNFLVDPSMSTRNGNHGFLSLIRSTNALTSTSDGTDLDIVVLVNVIYTNNNLLKLTLTGGAGGTRAAHSNTTMIVFVNFYLVNFRTFSGVNAGAVAGRSIRCARFVRW